MNFPYSPMLNKVRLWQPSWLTRQVIKYISDRSSHIDHTTKVWFQLRKHLQKKKFNEFPIRTNVKLSSAVAAILVCGQGHKIQFLKRFT